MPEESTAVTVATDPAAMEIIKKNMIWAISAGLLPIPLVEVAAITAVEVKLIKELSEHYNRISGKDPVPFRNDLAKSAVASLLASLGSVTLGKMVARSAFRFIPVVGPLVAAASLSAVAAGITYAVGRVFSVHFATGGTLLDFKVDKIREFFRKEFAIGLKEAANLSTSSAHAH